MWQFLTKHKAHVSGYTLLIVLGVGGYTDLLLELGELRATVKYDTQTIERLTGEYAELDARLADCLGGT